MCASVCVRAYVCRGCCNINARIKIDTREWVVGSRLWCYKIVCFESQHDKTNKVVVRPAKTPPSLIRVFAGALSVTKRPNDSSCGQRRHVERMTEIKKVVIISILLIDFVLLSVLSLFSLGDG